MVVYKMYVFPKFRQNLGSSAIFRVHLAWNYTYIEWTLNASSVSARNQSCPGSPPPLPFACRTKKEERESLGTRLHKYLVPAIKFNKQLSVYCFITFNYIFLLVQTRRLKDLKKVLTKIHRINQTCGCCWFQKTEVDLMCVHNKIE